MEESPYLKAHEALRQKLEALPLIGSLSREDQRLILGASRIRRFDEGESIMREGDYDHWIYILIQGTAEVSKSSRVLARLDQTGETFGELCLIDRKPRSATVKAVKNTVCLAIDTSLMGELDPLLHDAFYALIYRLFAELLAARLRATNEELIEVKEELEYLRNRRALRSGSTTTAGAS